MSDEIIVGIFTLLGTILGFALTKISDYITSKRQIQNNQRRLLDRLLNIDTTIMLLKDNTEKMDKIITKKDLESLHKILNMCDIRDELSKIETLLEKPISFDNDKYSLFVNFSILKVHLNGLLTFFESNPDNFENKKAELICRFDECHSAVRVIYNPVKNEYHSCIL